MQIRINPNEFFANQMNVADSTEIARLELRSRLLVFDDIYYLRKRQAEYPPVLIRMNHVDLKNPIVISSNDNGIDYYDLEKRVRRQMKC